MSNVRVIIWQTLDRGIVRKNGVLRAIPEVELAVHRFPEYSYLNYPAIFDGEWESIVITDGIGQTDDTVTMKFPGNYVDVLFPAIRGNSEAGIALANQSNIVMAVAVESRLFGVYDVERIGVSGEHDETTITGKVDRQFEETIFNLYGEIWAEILSGEIASKDKEPPIRIGNLIRQVDPYLRWGDAYLGVLQGTIAKAQSLPSLRSAFGTFSIGISPLTYVTGDYDVFRDIDIYNLYPVDREIGLQISNSVSYDVDNNPVISSDSVSIPPEITLTEEDILVSPQPSFNIPDVFNLPGTYKSRLISPEVQSFHVDLDIFESGTKLPRVDLDISALNGFEIRTFIENKRWELQNTAASATLSIYGNPLIVPRQVINIPEHILGYPQWRTVAVKHTISASEDTYFQTDLVLSLFQGNWNEADQPKTQFDIFAQVLNQA